MVDTPLSSYPDRTLTRLLGHDLDNLVGKTNNLPVSLFDGGIGASSTSFWRGDGHWGSLGLVARTVLAAPTTFFINVDTGVDTSARDGLTALTAWKTPGYAQRFVAQNYDLAGQTITFQFADSVNPYNSVNGLTSFEPSAPSTVYWRGNPTTPANVLWQSTTTNPVLRIAPEMFLISTYVNGFTMSNANEALIDATRMNASCSIAYTGTVEAVNLVVKNVPNQYFIFEGSMGLFGNLTMDWTGNSNQPWCLFDSGAFAPNAQSICTGTITITGSPTFYVNGGLFTGLNQMAMFATVTGTFTGKRYSKANISTNVGRQTFAPGASLPGDIATIGGTFLTGSSYTRYTVDGVFADGVLTSTSPASGSTLTVLDTHGEVNITNGSTLAALTITLKPLPYDNEIVTIRTNAIVTAVTWAGGSFIGAPAGLAIGETRLRYDLTAATWYALGMSAGGGSGTPGGSPTQLQYNLGSAFTGVAGSAVTAAGGLTLNNGVVTTDNPVLNLSQEWNAGGVTFTGIKTNITNTASAVGSKMLDLQVDGSSKLAFGVVQSGSQYLLSLSGGFTASDLALRGMFGAIACVSGNAATACDFQAGNISASTIIASVGIYLSGSTARVQFGGAGDPTLTRQGANILGLSNGANATAFRVYNTTDDNAAPTTYERGVIDWTTTANTLTIGTQHLGATGRNVRLVSAGGNITVYRSLAGAVPANNALLIDDVDSNVGNTSTHAQLYIRNQRAAASGHASVVIDKGASSAGCLFGFLTAGVEKWDAGLIVNDNFTIRETNGVYQSLFVLTQGAPASSFVMESTGALSLFKGQATPAGGSASIRLVFGSTAGFGVYVGSGAPTVSAAQGSLYLRSDGSSNVTRMYVNTNGSTTWTAVNTVA